MKNIIKSTLFLLAAGLMVTACSDDNGSNPTLLNPSTFQLNTPAYSQQAVDLFNSETVNFTWSQPDYGFPAATEYQLQVSKDGNFTVSYDEEVADESGETIANYTTLEQYFTTCEGGVDAQAFNKALQQLFKWEEGEAPESQKVWVRATATTKGNPTIYSNVVELFVKPYFTELKPADPVLWYMVGNCIGSKDWDNGEGSIGTGLVPLLPIPGETYDADGNGLLIYAGFFPAGGQFKFIKIPGKWDDQMNYTNLKGDAPVTDEDGDNHNIGIPEDGFYKITMNTVDATFTMERMDGNYSEHSTITMPGDYQGWDAAGNAMTAMGKRSNTQTHDWYLDTTFESNAELKFANGTWDVNWGGNDFPLGYGTQGGPNIPVKAGGYRVYFNDILGLYYFIVTE